MCTAPSSSPGNVSLEVSNNGVDFTKTGLRFTFKETMTFQMSPSRGPVVGGTVVTVTGLDNSGDVMQSLVFGSMRVPIEVREGVARAIVPAGPGAGVVDVTSDELGSDLGVQYEYQEMVHVHAVRPSSGSLQGGNRVTITGEGFDVNGTGYCRFGGDEGASSSLADVLTSSTAVCVVPARLQPEVVAVEVSFSDGQALSLIHI